MESPHQTMNNMVIIQLLSCGHNNKIWCLCYQYTICTIYRLINRWLGTPTVVDLYAHKNIYCTIPFSELIIWGCKIYIINSKQVKKALDL